MGLKKSITIAALTVCAITVIGLITAYLTDADTKANTFTVGEVEIEINEENWKETAGQEVRPYTVIEKDPVVINKGKNACLTGISVEGIKGMVNKGFIIGKVENGVLANGAGEVFSWNEKFHLVTRDGIEIEAGQDQVLTLAELNNLITDGSEDKLYFAYDSVLDVGDSTEALFNGVIYNEELPESSIEIIRYFTTNDGADIYYPDANGCYSDDEPSKDAEGNYIYKYTVSVNGSEKPMVYESYEAVKEGVDSYKAELEEEVFLSVKGAAIQALNDSVDGWTDIEKWYPMLSSQF